MYGGLGNQLFQLAAALSTLGNRRLKLDIDLNSTDGSILQFVLPPEVDVVLSDSRNKKLGAASKACNLYLRIGTKPNPSIIEQTLKFFLRCSLTSHLSLRFKQRVKLANPLGLGYSNLSSSAKNSYLIGYMQSYVWTENSEVLEKLKQMNLKSQSASFDKFWHEVQSKKILAVHVRLGDYQLNPKFGRLNENYYARAIQAGFDRNQYDCIWVFSNDILGAKYVLKFLEQSSLEIHWVDDSDLSAPEVISLLKSCHGIVIANSSFGWWGARLNHSSSKFIAAPDPWFSEIDAPRLLIPPNWTLIDSMFGNSSE
jgi:hypothetical protein